MTVTDPELRPASGTRGKGTTTAASRFSVVPPSVGSPEEDSTVPEEPAPTPRGLLRRLVSFTTTILLILTAAAFLILAIGPRIFGYQTATMLTASMAPEIMPGDVVVTTRQPVSEVEVGDVISFHIPIDDNRVETHRIIEVIDREDGSTAVRTQGDANDGADPWEATFEGDYVHEVSLVIPELGNVIRALRAPVLNNVLVYGSSAVLVVVLLSMIWSKPTGDAENTPEEAETEALDVPDGLPILDPAVIDGLADELPSREDAHRYLEGFARLLPQRLEEIGSRLEHGDIHGASNVLLSVNVGAAMAGAARLGYVSSAMLDTMDSAGGHFDILSREAGAFLANLPNGG